ncbi:MAG: DUF937 domain-containing protein [Terriglobia bacterium]
MDLLSMVLNAGGGDGVRRLGQNFGLNENQTSSAIGSLLPALGQGLARNATSPGGLESLIGALSSGGHERYIDDPEALGSADTVQDGNGILGHVLGSKDVSRQVANNAAAQTGIGADVLKKMLPVVATMAMGALSKQRSSAGPQALSGSPGSSGLMGVLGQFLGSGQGGSSAGDILGGIASQLFK